jgi:hypothetical protein
MDFPVADTARQTERDHTFFLGSVLISQSSHVCGSDSMINVTGPFDVIAKIAFLFAAENLERTRKT